MKKRLTALVVIIILIILSVGTYILFRKPTKPSTVSSTSLNTTASTVNNAIVVTKSSKNLGPYLAEPNGAPLYTYSGDSSGKSTCTSSCLAMWPAYQDTGVTADLPNGIGTIKRTDNGEIQYTYHGLPLYTYVSDKGTAPTGNGIQGFNLAKPSTSIGNSSSW